MTRHTPQTPEYIKIDEKSNIDQIGLDHKLSNSAIIGLKEFLNKAKQDKHEDVLYITKEELKEFHGMNIPKRLRYLEKQEERVTDSYELLQDTHLALNLAGGNKEKITEGRELLQKFSDKVDQMSEDFLFSTHDSPLFGAELQMYQKRNLITGLSFYASEIALGKDGLKDTIESGINTIKGGFWSTVVAIGSNLSNIPKFFEPFTEVFNTLRDSSGSAMKATIVKHPEYLENPLDAKNLISHVAAGSKGALEGRHKNFSAKEKKKLTDIGKKWEEIITPKNGNDIKGFSDIVGTTGGKKSIENKLKVFFTTSIGETVKKWIQDDSFLSLIIAGLFSLLGFDMAEILGEDKLDENNVAAFRSSVVQNFSNIKNAQLLLTDKDGKFDEAIGERLYALKKDDEDLIDTLKRIHNNSDFKQIGKKLTSTKGTVQDDAFTVGMDEAINLYYDFEQAKKQNASFSVNTFISEKLTTAKNDNNVSKDESKKLIEDAKKPKEQVESVEKKGDSLFVISKINNQVYNTEMRKNGYIVVKSKDDTVKYQITNSLLVGQLSTLWGKPLTHESKKSIQDGVNKVILDGTNSTNGKFKKSPTLKFQYKVEGIKKPIHISLSLVSITDKPTEKKPNDEKTVIPTTDNAAKHTGSETSTSTVVTTAVPGNTDAATTKVEKQYTVPELVEKPLSEQVKESETKYLSQEKIDSVFPKPEKDLVVGEKQVTVALGKGTYLEIKDSNEINIRISKNDHTEVYEYTNSIQSKPSDLIETVNIMMSGFGQIIGSLAIEGGTEKEVLKKFRELINPQLNKAGAQIIPLGLDENGVPLGTLHLVQKYSSETPKQKETQKQLDEDESKSTPTVMPAKENPLKQVGPSPVETLNDTQVQPMREAGDVTSSSPKNNPVGIEKTEVQLQEERSMTSVLLFTPEYNLKKGVTGMFKKKKFHVYIVGKSLHIDIEGLNKYKSVLEADGSTDIPGLGKDKYSLQFKSAGEIHFDTNGWFGTGDITIHTRSLIREVFKGHGNPINWGKSPITGKRMYFTPNF